MIKYIALVCSVVSVSFISLIILGVPLSSFAVADAPSQSGAQIDIWWPTDGAHVSGVQPFKAVLAGQDVATYDMYWQVDGGTLVDMQTNATDAPHKEASVDVSSWNWHGGGPYLVNFVAKQNGSVVGEHSVNIYIDNGSQPASNSQTTAATSSMQTTATVDIATVPALQPSAASPSAQPAANNNTIDVWWPTPGAWISGVQPFKAVLANTPLDSYRMYWAVDGGSPVEMQDSTTDAPHKEASVDVSSWNWNASGAYTITFVAKDSSGATLASYSEQVNVKPSSGSPQTQTQTTTQSTPITQSPLQPAGGSSGLYVNPNSSATHQAAAWRTSRPGDAADMDILAEQPTAAWFGDWNSNIYNDVHSYVSSAAAAGKTATLVAYDIPGRDCGGYSSGGSSAGAYNSWVGSVASAIGDASAIVILEPDALAGISCLSQSDQQARLSLLQSAVKTLKSHANTRVYLDAGHSGWNDPSIIAGRLSQAGISQADGFALNVSNFDATQNETAYGAQISQLLGGTHFVIDTSRNGLGSNGMWCNPPGRAIGQKPTLSTGTNLVDAYLWIKTPGESDGTCNGGPSAGTWWPDYALQLVKNTQ